MNRWNISHLIFYSKNNLHRTIEFNVNDVTIITGASNTGKSAVITAIDYCLGSSTNNIPAFVSARVTHIATKWSDGTTEFVIGREISKSGKASGNMYFEYGADVDVPISANDLNGRGNIEEIKALLENLFGFTVVNESDNVLSVNKISIRQITPFIYLDKKVIDSDTTLMYGLDDQNASKRIIDSLPYFLGAIDLKELEAMRRLRGLKKGIESEERKQILFEQHQIDVLEKCRSLLAEASQVGLFQMDDSVVSANKDTLIDILERLTKWEYSAVNFENDDVLKSLQIIKSNQLAELNILRRKKTAAIQMNSTTDDYDKVVEKQLSKLDLSKFFQHTEEKCPVCSSDFKEPNEISKMIENSIVELRRERKVVKNHKPAMNGFVKEIDEKIDGLQININKSDNEIRNLIKESEVAQNQLVLNQNISRIIGRISYFLDNHTAVEAFDQKKLNDYNREIEQINSKYGKSHKEERIALAERKISKYATANLKELPRGIPIENCEVNFFSKQPKLVITDAETERKTPFANIGSDENYLSLHLSFAFAFQRFLSEKKSSVPGLLILDQVSRPYYSNKDSDDEKDIKEVDINNDDDSAALEKHFNFIFKQVQEQKGLQVIILEHAYLSYHEAYKKATKYKWPKIANDKLIPSDWPEVFES
ncbi:DUF3732 domain-containing protein [Mucilaginibacter sp. SJ]|uniref:DUF3732 domain-containing protein n=1 Tax=Mucilaginibacter sp. SJ TaxID=3029053 RepID=UPI0023A9468A|nr:DUF3732 domain-containing protein [Mucilaginibacter sp. SJ]WEA01772.1 DUF3732 domain-containing protein [Mucilaginibacter sp. SJ]